MHRQINRDVQNIFLNFGLVFEKNKSDSVWNEFDSVRFEKNVVRFGYYSYLLLM